MRAGGRIIKSTDKSKFRFRANNRTGHFMKIEEFLKNGAFWDVTPCGSCKNRRFGGT
jgi:hypothetical protein